MTKKLLVIFILIHFKTSAWSADCPGWYNGTKSDSLKDLPFCPVGKMVPETYPVAAVLVSDATFKKRSPEFVATFIKKIVASSPPEKVPALIISGNDETIKTLKREINSLLISPQAKTQALKAIIQIKDADHIWQQDYFKSFQSKNGNPELRNIENYSARGETAGGKKGQRHYHSI